MSKVTPEIEEIIVNLYKKGMSPYEISDALGGRVTHTAIRNRLIDAGVEMRSRSDAKKMRSRSDAKKKHPNVPEVEVLKKEYLDEGQSCYALGKKYDVSPAVIWYRLNKAGVPMKEISQQRRSNQDQTA